MLDPELLKLEKNISLIHDTEYTCMTGNATISITIALEVLELKGKRIGVPASVCFSVPQAVLYSGNIPVFLDVESEKYGISAESIRSVDVSAVIAVHAFGMVCDIEKIKKVCNELGVYLIEDCAVAQGASINNTPVGSFGDLSILSFGSGKIIDIGHGGALMTNNTHINKLVRQKINTLPVRKSINENSIDALGKLFTTTYNDHCIKGKKISTRFFKSLLSNKDSYVHQFDHYYIAELNQKLNNLNENIYYRDEKALKIRKLLAGIENIELSSHEDGDVYWRQNIFIKKHRNQLLAYLLEKNYEISSWYPTIEPYLMPDEYNRPYPCSDLLTNSILNLWVNDQVNNKYAVNITDDIKRFLDLYV